MHADKQMSGGLTHRLVGASRPGLRRPRRSSQRTVKVQDRKYAVRSASTLFSLSTGRQNEGFEKSKERKEEVRQMFNSSLGFRRSGFRKTSASAWSSNFAVERKNCTFFPQRRSQNYSS